MIEVVKNKGRKGVCLPHFAWWSLPGKQLGPRSKMMDGTDEFRTDISECLTMYRCRLIMPNYITVGWPYYRTAHNGTHNERIWYGYGDYVFLLAIMCSAGRVSCLCLFKMTTMSVISGNGYSKARLLVPHRKEAIKWAKPIIGLIGNYFIWKTIEANY